ncbi:DUF2524 family protein [Bacillus massiliglaciei]|uniref:DUF2524 family protein n=1 Tax=Bacillus massiliglaciei TaxID=1816693 RepID=UPI000DA62AEA|nr:DUF2524 family protein [Bacillus massiliglaciei]
MATRESLDQFLEVTEGTLRFAQFEYTEASRQEHYEDESYRNAQSYIEESLTDLERLYNSANDQQREMLDRKRRQLNQLKNEMIFLQH